jgi:hypothetical protein
MATSIGHRKKAFLHNTYINKFTMLRWTDRLKNILIASGVEGIDFPISEADPDFEEAFREDWEELSDWPVREIREAEFIPRSELAAPSKRCTRSSKRLKASDSSDELVDSAGTSDITSEFPPELRWDDLGQWLHLLYSDDPLCVDDCIQRERRPETRPCPFADDCIDIFWVSPDEFISLSEIIRHCEHYSVQIGQMEGPINVYHRATFETFSYGEESAKGPTPMAAFRFIKHLFAPFEEELTKYSCRFNARHVESITPAMYTSFLSIASSLDRDDKLSFRLSGNLFRDPLQELTMIQFHPSIQLKIEPNFGYDLNVTKKELMDIARDFYHLSHWPVGDFPCLVANSLVESLHLSRHNNGPGWSESVAELSQNQKSCQLSLPIPSLLMMSPLW